MHYQTKTLLLLAKQHMAAKSLLKLGERCFLFIAKFRIQTYTSLNTSKYRFKIKRIWKWTKNIYWQKLFDATDIVYNIFHYNNKIYYSSFKVAPNDTIKMFHLDKLTEKNRIILAEQPDPLVTVKEFEIKSYDGTLVPLTLFTEEI